MPQMRGVLLPMVVLAMSIAGAQPSADLQQRRTDPRLVESRRKEIEKTFDAYAGGDREVVARTIRRQLDQATRIALVDMLGDPHALWNPTRAAFVMEIAVSLDRTDPGSVFTFTLLRLGRGMFSNRPAIGADPAGDRFEVLWHQIALGLLQGNGVWFDHDAYLTAISPRVTKISQVKPPIANRFALARGFNAALQCCATLMSPPLSRTIVVTGGGLKPAPPADSAVALRLFETAAADPALRVEALVQGAYVESLVGHLRDAIAWLDRAEPITELPLAYAAAMIRAGVLDRQSQPASAADSYAAAERLAPGVQTPLIGRAAALQRAGRTDEAVAEAVRARQLKEGAGDPWLIFRGGDARFVDAWLLELRGLLR